MKATSLKYTLFDLGAKLLVRLLCPGNGRTSPAPGATAADTPEVVNECLIAERGLRPAAATHAMVNTGKTAPEPGEPRAVLIVKPDHLGDVILSTGVVAALKRKFSSLRICFLAKESSLPVLLHNPDIDRLVRFDAPWGCHPFEKSFSYMKVLSLARELRLEGFDVVLSMQEDPRNHLFAALCGAPRRVGRAPRAGAPLLTDLLPALRDGEHAVDGLNGFAAVLGAETAGCFPRVYLTDVEKRHNTSRMRSLGLQGGTYAVLHIGAGHPGRIASAACLAALVRRLPVELKLQVLVVSGEREDWKLSQIRRELPFTAINCLRAPTLRELAATIEGASLFIGHDTGPTHLAAAVGTPVVALFGPSSPERWGPVGERIRVVRNVVCAAPCGSRPRCTPCRCMEAITVAQVIDACREVIA